MKYSYLSKLGDLKQYTLVELKTKIKSLKYSEIKEGEYIYACWADKYTTLKVAYKNDNSFVKIEEQRVAINNDFYFIQYYIGQNKPGGLNGKGAGYYNRYWVELNSSLYTEYSISNRIFLLASIMNTNSMNYRWVRNEDGSKWDKPSSLSDKYNTRLNFSMRFYLN